MCLIAFAWNADARYRLVVAANRDEFHARKTAPAAFWDDAPQILAGRDLQEGGTWMGVARGMGGAPGRFAAVTNRRSLHEVRAGAPSRGHLVGNFLRGAGSPKHYLAQLTPAAARYSGFNLIVADQHALYCYDNSPGSAPQELEPGIYALSNGTLSSDWPKMRRVRDALQAALNAPALDDEALFTMLADRRPAADAELPDTGVGREFERLLSSPFVCSPAYGTRSSTLLTVDREGQGRLTEQRFDPKGNIAGTVSQEFRWP